MSKNFLFSFRERGMRLSDSEKAHRQQVSLFGLLGDGRRQEDKDARIQNFLSFRNVNLENIPWQDGLGGTQNLHQPPERTVGHYWGNCSSAERGPLG